MVGEILNQGGPKFLFLLFLFLFIFFPQHTDMGASKVVCLLCLLNKGRLTYLIFCSFLALRSVQYIRQSYPCFGTAPLLFTPFIHSLALASTRFRHCLAVGFSFDALTRS